MSKGQGAQYLTSTTLRKPEDCKVYELKRVLAEKGLSTVGRKAELINRLWAADPFGDWLRISDSDSENENPTMQHDGASNDVSLCNQPMGQRSPREDGVDEQHGRTEVERGGHFGEHMDARALRRECELFRREKEVAERELAVARRELELLRMSQRNDLPRGNRTTTSVRVDNQDPDNAATVPHSHHTRVSVTAVADLLSDYHGNAEDFEKWDKQTRFLRMAYKLDDNLTKVLIGTRLKGRAADWFHSKPEYITMTSDELLGELRGMFCHHPNKTVLRRRLEARVWKKDETFHDYVHEKVIMANRIAVDDDEILRSIIEGIPDRNLQDLARVQKFSTVEQILQAFEEVRLEDRRQPIFPTVRVSEKSAVKSKSEKGAKDDSGEKRSVNSEKKIKRCFNCGLTEHFSANCPTKDKGIKCFRCGEHGHIASKCPGKEKTASSCAITYTDRQKRSKNVLINGISVRALIDTGSDITIMRADEFNRIGSPKLERERISFRGLGEGQSTTIGGFRAKLTVDGNSYTITVHVVPDEFSSYELLIGKDFLDTIELNVKLGIATIRPTSSGEAFAEICAISINDGSDDDVVSLSHLRDDEIKEKLRMLVNGYKPEQTRDVGIRMKLIVTDDEPVNLRPRRLAPIERDEVNGQIDKWLEAGVVQPSVSDYASPVVLARKKDGSVRLCVDFRLLNKKIVKDRYPLPLVEDQLDALQNAKVFSTLDLKSGFFHVPVDEVSRKYTAFVVPDGHYEFTRMPFGLCNAPAVFQKFINTVFRGLIREKVVLVYMDDLIVPSVDCVSGLEKLERVLETASRHGLIINWKKCDLLQTRVNYLGHVIEDGRVRPSELKTAAVRSFPVPSNLRQVRQFLGLTGYFRKFVPGYSVIARPLTDLLRAGAEFNFESSAINAFKQLKTILVNKPLLRLYKLGAETELHTDASSHGYGAILLQRSTDDNKMHPVYYASGKTTPAEQKYISYELEVLAVVRALKKFRVYLLHTPFKIVTDCRAFTLTMAKKDLCLRVARWALVLEDYNYQIEHRSSKRMGHVDALSRNPLPTCLLLEEAEDGLTARLKRAQDRDDDIKKIVQLVREGKAHGYTISGGLLFKEVGGDVRLVVPKAMCSQVIRRAHERGHFSVMKTEAIIKREYHIQNLRTKIEKVIKNCIDCILSDRKQGKQEGFLCPIDKGEVPLDTYHVDHLGPLVSTAKSYRHIFVVVDGFSKFTWLYATKSTGTAEVLSCLRRQAVIFGNPRRIVSDRGTAFTSGDFSDYSKREKIQHILTTTGMPRANGQVERVNRTLISLLTKLASPKPGEWYRYLDMAQQYFNTTIQRSISMSPFYLLFGTHARLREDHNVRELLEQEWASAFQDKRDETRLQAKECISKIQRENKRTYNKKRKAAQTYHEGDLVAIKKTQQAPGSKFAFKYFGPYEVVKLLRNNRYIVRKVGEHEGPQQTSSSADFLKPWLMLGSDEEMSDGDEKRSEAEEDWKPEMEETSDENIRGRI